MKIVLTHDPRWEYSPRNRPPFWASLDTVDYVTGLLRKTGNDVLLIRTDAAFESRLREIRATQPDALVFWLNELLPTDSGKDDFTVRVIERVGMMHTGPDSGALGTGLDKETTKGIFRRLGLPTPESYIVDPDDYSPIRQHGHWAGCVIVKPLLQGNSRGIDEFSVLGAGESEAIGRRVELIHSKFGEPALVERYVGGESAMELTAPMLVSHDGRLADLPLTEIDLHQIPAAQGRFRFLTHNIKDEKYYLKIPADVSPQAAGRIRADVARIIRAIGCRDMARVDVRGDSTGLYYIEVNVNPGKNRFSYLTTSAYSAGLDYAELIAFIPYSAMLRYGLEPPSALAQLVRPVVALFARSQAASRTRAE